MQQAHQVLFGLVPSIGRNQEPCRFVQGQKIVIFHKDFNIRPGRAEAEQFFGGHFFHGIALLPALQAGADFIRCRQSDMSCNRKGFGSMSSNP